MNRFRTHFLSCLIAVALASSACSPAGSGLDPNADAGAANDSGQVCPNGTLECTGDPDDGTLICRCSGFFDCPTPEKCESDAPVPPGSGSWSCTWQEFKYTCTSTDVQSPPGGGGWTCFTTEQGVTCIATPIAPDGTGTWVCKVVGSKLECEKKPAGTIEWGCTEDKKQCTGGSDELPGGGGTWRCHQTLQNGVPTWVCVGEPTSLPGGGGWTCVKLAEPSTYRCEKEVETPPGGGRYECVMGTEFGGITCDLVPPKKNGEECAIGEKKWCDGLTYCGWGQVQCDPVTRKWKTKKANNKVVEDCYELADAARPNTVCACYHFYFNAQCCERPDCVIPAGSKPQICPQSPGNLCDYCNPKKPECKGVGAECVTSNAHETFCSTACSTSAPCPAGYVCLLIKGAKRCVPSDFSCYF